MKTIYKYIGSVAMALSCTMAVSAQSVFSIDESIQSVRSLGMGGIAGAMDANAFSIRENASKVAFSDKRAELGVQYGPWKKNQTEGTDRDNILINIGGYVSLTGGHKLLFGVNYYAPGGYDMYETDENGDRVSDERLKPGYVSASLGYATKWGENLGLSAVINYANWDMGYGPKTSALSIDLGLTHRFVINEADYLDASFRASGWGGVFGAHADEKMPGIISAGGLYHTQFNQMHGLRLGVDLGARCLEKAAFNGSLGAEYTWKEMFFVRTGYHYTSYENDMNGYGSVSLGVCLFNKVQADASYLLAQDDSPLKKTFMVGLSVKF